MNKKQKLELTWIGKEKRPRLESRILLEEPDFSYKVVEVGTLETGETADLFAEQSEVKPKPFEWDHDDYSFDINVLPEDDEEDQ